MSSSDVDEQIVKQRQINSILDAAKELEDEGVLGFQAFIAFEKPDPNEKGKFLRERRYIPYRWPISEKLKLLKEFEKEIRTNS